jgi:hypothetical protein
MNKQSKNNYEAIQSELEKKRARRERKKRPKMKVSGAGVKRLAGLIINKRIK